MYIDMEAFFMKKLSLILATMACGCMVLGGTLSCSSDDSSSNNMALALAASQQSSSENSSENNAGSSGGQGSDSSTDSDNKGSSSSSGSSGSSGSSDNTGSSSSSGGSSGNTSSSGQSSGSSSSSSGSSSNTDTPAQQGGGDKVTQGGGTVATEGKIQPADKPVMGFATKGTSYITGGKYTIVTTKSQLVSALKTGGLIYVKGTIDLSEGMLPKSAGGSTSALDKLVTSTISKYSSYNDFKTKYAASCSKTTDHKSSSTKDGLGPDLWKLNKAYQAKVLLKVPSNTTIIGLDGSLIKGGAFSINSVSNVVLRNLHIQDAYDPFPHHESEDGFNAELDCICISGTGNNFWIDHCTLEDTMYTSDVSINGGSEKWQTYDGLCDMKDTIANVTVSACVLKNHDKTMLIGSSDTNGDNQKRTISLIGNYFYNCGQRLPMCRNTSLHVLNNYYDASSPHYAQQYAVGVRKDALIIAEGNYFGSGIQYSFKDDKDSKGKLYESGNTDKSKKGCGITTIVSSKPFTVPYSYTPLSADDAKANVLANAGAGKWSVEEPK